MANPLVKLARSQILRLLDGQRVQVPTSVGLLEIESKTDEIWQPLKLLPPDSYGHLFSLADSLGSERPSAVWKNDRYEVMVYDLGPAQHLSIKRLDRAAIRNWRHFQQIKNEVAGEFREAVELFPSEERIADNANQYHLWVLPDGERFPLGFGGGAVTISEEDVAAWNEAPGPGRQEPMQPGLTVGAKMDAFQKAHGIDMRRAGQMVTDAAVKAIGADKPS